MKNLLLKIIIVSPLLFNGILFSQNNRYEKELLHLKTENFEFDSIITDAANHIKKCGYYSKGIVFNVIFGKRIDSTYIELVAIYDKKTALTDQYWKPIGYFLRNDHYFFVFCDSIPKLFTVTGDKKVFVINDIVDVAFVADYPDWLYLFDRNKFVLQKAINQCRDKN